MDILASTLWLLQMSEHRCPGPLNPSFQFSSVYTQKWNCLIILNSLLNFQGNTLLPAVLAASFCIPTNSAKGSSFPTSPHWWLVFFYSFVQWFPHTGHDVDLERSLRIEECHMFRKYVHGQLRGMKLWATEGAHSKVTTYAHRRRPHLTATYHKTEIPFLWVSTGKCAHGRATRSVLPESGR